MSAADAKGAKGGDDGSKEKTTAKHAFDVDDFFEEDAQRPGATDCAIAKAEETLGYKLPEAYKALVRKQNGGVPKRTSILLIGVSDAEEALELENILGVGVDDGIEQLSQHQLLFEVTKPNLECGRDGEPSVVNVDQEDEFRILKVAENFGEFISKLKSSEDLEKELEANVAAEPSPGAKRERDANDSKEDKGAPKSQKTE